MQIPIVIESLPGNRFRAKSASLHTFAVEGESAEKSLRLWQERFASVLPADAVIVRVESPPTAEHSLTRFAGRFKDDPLFDEWQKAIEEFRQKCDVEAGLPADTEASGNSPPWARFIGDLKDDPLVEVWRECLEEYRTQRDVKAGIE